MGNTFSIVASRDHRERRIVGDAAPTELQCTEHAVRVLAALDQLRRDVVHCDVLLQVERESGDDAVDRGPGGSKAADVMAGQAASQIRGVWAHSAVLAAASPYFYEVFSSSFKERTNQVFMIKGVKLKTLRALVENIYSPASLAVSVEDAKLLMAAATMLKVDEVCDAACACLAQALTADNALGILVSAQSHGCTALAGAAIRYIQYHGERVLQGDELLTLEFNTLLVLLRNDRLAAREECVFDAVLRWTQHCPQERRQYLPALMRAVRLRQVPRPALIGRASSEPLVSEPQGLLLIIDALTANRERREHHRRRPPRNTQPPIALLVIGGWLDDTGCTDSVLVCSLPADRWRQAAKLPEPRDNAGVALLDGCVYIIGGQENDYSHVRSVFVYNAALDSWSPGPKMTKARGWPGAAVLGARVYAAGGWRGTEWGHTAVFKSAEALDPREGVWRSIAPMATRRSGLGVAALDGMLYAVGGYDGHTQVNSAERYDPTADRWETVEAMVERRDNVRVGVLDHALYAVGGRDERNNRLRSVERYRAGSGWETAPPLPAARGNAAVTAHGGRLYAAGGHDGRKRLTAVSVFDPVTAAWSELPALPAPRSAAVAAAVVVPWPS